MEDMNAKTKNRPPLNGLICHGIWYYYLYTYYIMSLLPLIIAFKLMENSFSFNEQLSKGASLS